MPADPAILQRIRGCPFARGGRVLVRFRANGYSLVARRSDVPLARLRLTGEGDDVVLLYPSHRGGWEPPGDFGRSPCRSTSPSNTSAPIRTSWNSVRPTAELRHPSHRSTADLLPCKLQFYRLNLIKRVIGSAKAAKSSAETQAPRPAAIVLISHVSDHIRIRRLPIGHPLDHFLDQRVSLQGRVAGCDQLGMRCESVEPAGASLGDGTPDRAHLRGGG